MPAIVARCTTFPTFPTFGCLSCYSFLAKKHLELRQYKVGKVGRSCNNGTPTRAFRPRWPAILQGQRPAPVLPDRDSGQRLAGAETLLLLGQRAEDSHLD